MSELNKLAAETDFEYKKRLFYYKSKNPSVTWNDLATILNKELHQNCTSEKYKKELNRKFRNKTYIAERDSEEISDDAELVLAQIRKEKTFLQDLRRDANAQLRRVDREENIKEIALEYAEQMNQRKDEFTIHPLVTLNDAKKEGILCLSDWHYGIIINELFNKYDTEVCKQRVESIVNQAIDLGLQQKLKRIHVFNLSDLISGRIHTQLRMQSQVDTVSQTMEVAELLRQVLGLLSERFEVCYYDCLDNHSRIEPNKKESLQLESFTRIIHWYLQKMFENSSRVKIMRDICDDIIMGNILGFKILGVHGDKDAPVTVVQKMSGLIGERPNLILMAHRHHFSAEEQNTCVVLNNPSLMGSDRYALDKRMTSTPSQLFVIVSEDNVVHTVHKLNA